jgi:hypothetical protein
MFFLLSCSPTESPQSHSPKEQVKKVTQSQEQKGDETKDLQSQEQKEDKKKFLAFYNEVLKTTTIIDKLYDPIPKALQKKDIIRAVKLAKQRNNQMNKE